MTDNNAQSSDQQRALLREFMGLVWVGDEPATRVRVRAGSQIEAREILKVEYGEEARLSVWNEDDANQPREPNAPS